MIREHHDDNYQPQEHEVPQVHVQNGRQLREEVLDEVHDDQPQEEEDWGQLDQLRKRCWSMTLQVKRKHCQSTWLF